MSGSAGKPARSRRLGALSGIVLATAFSSIALAAPAQASTTRNGVCDPGEFCLYYNSNRGGSVSDFTSSIPNYGSSLPGCYVFLGPGAGRGLCVKNNAASVWNRTRGTVEVYYNSNYGGGVNGFGPGLSGNLASFIKNNNASHRLNAPGIGTT